MHYQSSTALYALLLALTSTTMATGMKPMCKRHSAIAIANGNAPDCSMAECADDGKLMMMSAPMECESMCKCAPPKKSTDAPVVKDNPKGVEYNATLPESTKSTIRGYVTGMSSDDGTGVDFSILLYGLPEAELGPFSYHIHDRPVPADGNCTGTGPHLDPYMRGQMPPCDDKWPETCEVGDLAGKYGKITGQKFQATYHDKFLSTTEGAMAFFGNRSVVFHAKNSTRLTCANFIMVDSMMI